MGTQSPIPFTIRLRLHFLAIPPAASTAARTCTWTQKPANGETTNEQSPPDGDQWQRRAAHQGAKPAARLRAAWQRLPRQPRPARRRSRFASEEPGPCIPISTPFPHRSRSHVDVNPSGGVRALEGWRGRRGVFPSKRRTDDELLAKWEPDRTRLGNEKGRRDMGKEVKMHLAGRSCVTTAASEREE